MGAFDLPFRINELFRRDFNYLCFLSFKIADDEERKVIAFINGASLIVSKADKIKPPPW